MNRVGLLLGESLVSQAMPEISVRPARLNGEL